MPSPLPRIAAVVLGELALLGCLAAFAEAGARGVLAAGVVPREKLALPGPLVLRPQPFLAFALREGAVRGAGTPGEARIGPHGFRGRAVGPKARETFRVLCVGDSVVFGDGLGEAETMPAQLEAELRRRFPARKPEVVNAGVLQYTSAESFAALALRGLDREPDAVVFYEGANDVAPRVVPGFRPDYAHYRAVWDRDAGDEPDRPLEASAAYLVMRWLAGVYPAALQLDWYTVRRLPRTTAAEREEAFAQSSEEPFLQNEKVGIALARSRGARSLVVAPAFHRALEGPHSYAARVFDRHRARQERIAKLQGAAFLDLTSALDPAKHLRDPVHLTAAGAQEVARRLADEIEKLGWCAR